MKTIRQYIRFKSVDDRKLIERDVIKGGVVDPDCFSCWEAWFIDSIYGLRSSDSPWDLVDLEDDCFRGYFEEVLLKDPEKYDCEEVDEEEEEGDNEE